MKVKRGKKVKMKVVLVEVKVKVEVEKVVEVKKVKVELAVEVEVEGEVVVNVKVEVVLQTSTLVRSMPSLSCDSRWRMMLRWSSRTPRSSSSLSSVSVTSSDGLMSSSPVCC